MAVIGAKLRAAHVLATPRSPGAASFSSRTGSQEQPQQQQQASRSGSVLVAAAVRRVAEACAPGRGGCGGNSDGDDDGGDSNGGGRGFPGLSLTTASALLLRAEKKTGRSGGSSAKGSTALVGACAALHVHLLEWLSLVVVSQEEDDGGRGVRVSLPPLTTGPAAAAAAAAGRAVKEGGEGDGSGSGRSFLVDFARRILLDFLFLFEKKNRLAASAAAAVAAAARDSGRRTTSRGEREEAFSRDPWAELLCAVMEALDGTGGGGEQLFSPPIAILSATKIVSPFVFFISLFPSCARYHVRARQHFRHHGDRSLRAQEIPQLKKKKKKRDTGLA